MEDRIKAYFANRPEVAAAYLFGSHASGSSRPGSDVDIAVLIVDDDEISVNRLTKNLQLDLSRLTRKDIHLVVMNNASTELLRQILDKGRCLHNKAPDYLSKFNSKTLSQIAEYGYYRRIFQRAVHDRIMGDPNKNGRP